jgi:antirestriction protein
MSYVYFILDETSNAIKIGKANDIDERISGLQTGNPNELIVLHYIKCKSVEDAFNLEKECHNQFNHIHTRGEWFRYDKELFQNFFIEETHFKIKSKRGPLINNTLFGKEIVFDVDTHPRCYFYREHVAQIYHSYEKASRLTIPFRTMKYPTYGKSLLLPYSNIKDRIFISTKKHEQNMELNRFKKTKNKESSLEDFFG